jgi:hypothetical protein
VLGQVYHADDEGLQQKSAVIYCPTFEPKSYQMTSIDPINPMLIHAIIYHLLTCPDDDDQLFWVGHLAHVIDASCWIRFVMRG